VLRSDDLLAARVLHRQQPDLRQPLTDGLRALAAAGPDDDGRTLLGDLTRAGTIARAQAEVAHTLVERWKRARAAGIYARLLVERGVAEAVAQGLVRSLGDDVDLTRLGEAALARGHVSADVEPTLRYQARQTYDQEARRQLEAFLERKATPGGDLGGEVPSGVFKLPVTATEAAEVTVVFDAAKVAPPLAAPRVPVPEGVDTSHPLVGRVVGRYRLLGKVGAGNMATVYLAEREDADTPFALKLVPPGASPEVHARFKREILANGFLQHEHVIDVFDAGATADGQQYLVMEFFESENLEQALRAQGTLSLRQALRVAQAVARALEAAHGAGIIHRDVKPANILVAKDGRAKLTDFGLALLRDLGEFRSKVFESESGGVTGTPEYLSPEQALSDPLGPPSDLYSLGLVLYRALSGRLPFQARSAGGWIQARLQQRPLPLAEAAPEGQWPAALLSLLDRLLVMDPARRIQTAREVAEGLEGVLDGLGMTGRRINPFRRGP
jgi:hypothetical protein